MTNRAVIDIETAVEQLGDLDFYLELVDEFIMDIPLKKIAISDSISLGNAQNLKLVSHSIKGVSANLQLNSVSQTAAALENAVKEERFSDYESLSVQLFSEFDKLIQERTGINQSI